MFMFMFMFMFMLSASNNSRDYRSKNIDSLLLLTDLMST